MRGLAAKAGVSASAMLRLAKRMGAADYTSFRDEFKERLRGQAPARPFTTRARQLQSQRQSGETLGLINEVLELRSEEHTSELQSLMRISYAVFCLKKKNTNRIIKNLQTHQS